MSNTELGVSHLGVALGSRQRSLRTFGGMRIEKCCWYGSAASYCFLYVLLCLDMCFDFSISLKHFLVFSSRVHIHKTRKFHCIKHEKFNDCSFQRVVFPSLLHQVLGIAYSLAKAIRSSVPLFSLLNTLALHT